MKQLGYYYSKDLNTVVIGFLNPKTYCDALVGEVIGHTTNSYYEKAFNVGYKYDRWCEGFVYVGKLTTFTTLKGYLDFLEKANAEQIEAYFKIKNIILAKHNSYIKKRKIDNRTYKYILYKDEYFRN